MIIRRFVAADAPAIERFNERLHSAGATWTVWVEGPPRPESPLRARMFVAEEQEEVRGAVWIHEHEFVVDGQSVDAGWAKYPVAESLVDSRHAGVASALLIKLLREQPRLMALGMGGVDGQFAKLLRSMRWHGMDVPFFVRLTRPSQVFRHLRALRATPVRRAALDLLAVSGLGWLGWNALQLCTRRRAPSVTGLSITIEPTFGEWADVVWSSARAAYSFVGRRDSHMLNVMYPSSMPVQRLRIRRGAEEVGWVVVLRRDLTDNPMTAFGPLRVGLIADGFSLPQDVGALVAAADTHLESSDVDLVFSNQLHERWQEALNALGYLRGPSQFAFFSSPKMSATFQDAHSAARAHINRGDCDGPLFA